MRTFLFAATLLLTLLLFCDRLQAQAEEKPAEKTTTADTVAGKTTTADAATIGKAASTPVRTNMLVMNPLKIILFYHLTYYHALTPNITVGGGLQAPTGSQLLGSSPGIQGFGANGETRLYPFGKWLQGFYIAPNASYNHLSSPGTFTDTVTHQKVTITTTGDVFQYGILIGWQWFPGDDFTLGDFAVGLGLGVDNYIWRSDSDLNAIAPIDEGIVPVFRVDIGYAW